MSVACKRIATDLDIANRQSGVSKVEGRCSTAATLPGLGVYVPESEDRGDFFVWCLKFTKCIISYVIRHKRLTEYSEITPDCCS